MMVSGETAIWGVHAPVPADAFMLLRMTAPVILGSFIFQRHACSLLQGWRVGYIAYPDSEGRGQLGSQLLKTQDTICICACQVWGAAQW